MRYGAPRMPLYKRTLAVKPRPNNKRIMAAKQSSLCVLKVRFIARNFGCVVPKQRPEHNHNITMGAPVSCKVISFFCRVTASFFCSFRSSTR